MRETGENLRVTDTNRLIQSWLLSNEPGLGESTIYRDGKLQSGRRTDTQLGQEPDSTVADVTRIISYNRHCTLIIDDTTERRIISDDFAGVAT